MDLSQFKISGSTDRLKDLKLQNFRLIKLRWLYIGVLTIVAAVSSLAAGLPSSSAKQYLIIGAIVFGINVSLYFINKLKLAGSKTFLAIMIFQLLLDLAVASFVTYGGGGVAARTTVLFVIPIVATGLIFGKKVVYLTGILSGIAYIVTLLLYNINLKNPLAFSQILVPVVFYPALFLIMAQLVAYLLKISTADTRDRAYDNFLALLSHQLIHPASTVRAIIDQLEKTPANSHDEIRKYIQSLKSENNDLLKLLNNLLETSSEYKVSGEEKIELNDILTILSKKMAINYGRPDDLKLDLGNNKLSVYLIKSKIITALVNVMDNAFKFSQTGSQVKITLRRSGTDALVVIEDKGQGMTEGVKKRMFTKYNADLNSSGGIKGLGLGLFVARKIIQAHRGTLHVFSDKMGTRVMIKLKKGRPHEQQ